MKGLPKKSLFGRKSKDFTHIVAAISTLRAKIDRLVPRCNHKNPEAKEAAEIEICRVTHASYAMYYAAQMVLSEDDFKLLVDLTGGGMDLVQEGIKIFESVIEPVRHPASKN